MRYILLTSVENPDVKGDMFSYKKTLFDIVRIRQNDEAMDYASMGKLLRLVEAVENAPESGYLQLNETDWELAKKKVEKHSWPFFNKMFYDFVAVVVNAPDVDPRETPAEDKDAKAEAVGEAHAA